MSIFDSVMKEHEENTLREREEETKKIEDEIRKEGSFIIRFTEATENIARPILDKFASDSIDYGYAAEVEVGLDGRGNKLVSLRIIPEAGPIIGNTPDNECVYLLKCLAKEQKVEHCSYYEQRRGKKPGSKKSKYGIQSINEDVIKRELKEFFKAVLAARKTI